MSWGLTGQTAEDPSRQFEETAEQAVRNVLGHVELSVGSKPVSDLSIGFVDVSSKIGSLYG